MVDAMAVRFTVCLFAVGLACGGSKPRIEPEPAWVAEYARIAQDGCACQFDPECLDAAHVAAVKMEQDHGGIDEMPPSVQVAHGELERCWREGTRDLGRDLKVAAEQVCRCADVACIDAYRRELVQLESKYGVNTREPQRLGAGPREELDRAAACIAGFTSPAEEYLEAMRGVAKTLCTCDSLECWQKAVDAPAPTFGDRFYVAELAAIDGELGVVAAKYCDCFDDVADSGAKDKVTLPRSPTSMPIRMGCRR